MCALRAMTPRCRLHCDTSVLCRRQLKKRAKLRSIDPMPTLDQGTLALTLALMPTVKQPLVMRWPLMKSRAQ